MVTVSRGGTSRQASWSVPAPPRAVQSSEINYLGRSPVTHLWAGEHS